MSLKVGSKAPDFNARVLGALIDSVYSHDARIKNEPGEKILAGA